MPNLPKFGVMFPGIDERHWHTVFAVDALDAAQRAARYVCDDEPEHLFGFHRDRVALVRPAEANETLSFFVKLDLRSAFEAVTA